MCAKILFDLILLGMPALIFADSVTVMDNGLLRLIYKKQVVFLTIYVKVTLNENKK